MEGLPRDILIEIALQLELPDLLKYCQSSKRINELTCASDSFWRSKIAKEYPMIDISKYGDPKDVYRKIKEAENLPQYHFNQDFIDQDYDMIEILPQIYKVYWPVRGMETRDEKDFYIGYYPHYDKHDLKSLSLKQLLYAFIQLGIPSDNDEINKARKIFFELAVEPPLWIPIEYKLIKDFGRVKLKKYLRESIKDYLREHNQIYPYPALVL